MRVFCPEHKRGFFTPRQSPIRCENRGHILAELDFEGGANPAAEIRWQYCCNCEYFCPTGFGQDSLERCPVCSRQTSTLYLCDRCYTISFESNTPIQTKNFTLSSEGAPQPSCPGCLQETSADLHEHTCDGLGASFVTALSSCPICKERLDIAPSFPSTVACYLKRTKAANKLNVTFDYESELFVPVKDGEFVLIRNGNETIVIPRTPRFATRRDFYQFYQDYYHCPKPGMGEVHIVQAAAVTEVADGWKLQTPGALEVIEDQPKRKADLIRPRPDKGSREEATPSVEEPTKEESNVTACAHCGWLIETIYPFCWKCGNPLIPKTKHSVTRSAASMEKVSSAPTATEEEEPTEQHHVRSVSSPIFSWALPKEPKRSTAATSAPPLKLIAVALVSLVLTSLALFVLMRSTSGMRSSALAQAVAQNQPADAGLAPNQEIKRTTAVESVPLRNSPARPEDAELRKLRERRMASGGASDRSSILQAFATAEKQYPNDYRFPYERAKLAIKAQQRSSHDEAFAALSLAAEKAINTGKVDEMLDSLEGDRTRDFRKLSHGHREWTQLKEALKNKDKSLLSAKKRLHDDNKSVDLTE